MITMRIENIFIPEQFKVEREIQRDQIAKGQLILAIYKSRARIGVVLARDEQEWAKKTRGRYIAVSSKILWSNERRRPQNAIWFTSKAKYYLLSFRTADKSQTSLLSF